MGFSLVVMSVVTQVPVEIDWEAEVDSPPPMVSAEVEVVPPMVAAVPEAQPVASTATTARPLPGPVAPNVVAPRGDAGVKAEVKKEAEVKKDAAPFWQVTALATANIPLSLDGAAFLYGLRGEIDVWRLSVVATFDRTGTTPFTMSETRRWNGLAGASVVATKNFRARLLGGVSALTTDTSAVFAPTPERPRASRGSSSASRAPSPAASAPSARSTRAPSSCSRAASSSCTAATARASSR